MFEVSMNFPDTLRAARKGDLKAFNHLVLQHQDQAYTLAYYLLGDEKRAATALQSAFLRAYAAIDSFHGGTFRGWLLRWVLTTCSDQPARKAPEPVSTEGELRGKLLSLPSDCLATAILVDLLGLDYEEAAHASGCSPKAMSYRLARARRELGSLRAGEQR